LPPARGRADNPAVVADRASDTDRERALAELSAGFAAGRLTHETFTYRVEQALRARANAELRGLVADLLPRPSRLGIAAAAAYRRVLSSADRWLRGRPPALALPAGSQRRFAIGRELACDMTLTDQTVSRWHASLECGPDGWLLADLGSANGTRVNGWRVTSPSRVRSGDLVSFGNTTFVLADRPR
jgi:Inner membrane component of T3SS, cytoplasmic domain/Domain of unknown function (DUF1707)